MPENRVGGVILLGAMAWGVGEGMIAWGLDGLAGTPGSAEHVTIAVLGTAARGVGWLLLVLVLPVVFPDGRVESRLAGRLAVCCVLGFAAAASLSPVPLEDRLAETTNPLAVPESWSILIDLLAVGSLALAGVGIVLAIRSLVRRWRRGDELQRQQVLIFGIAFAIPLTLVPLAPTPWVAPWMFAIVALPLPVAVMVAVLQRRLYDVPLALNKTLTYLSLSAVLATVYASIVAGVGVMLRDRGAPGCPSSPPGRRGRVRSGSRLAPARREPPDLRPLVGTCRGAGRDGRRLADAAGAPALLTSLTDELVHGLGLQRARITDRMGRMLAHSGDAGNTTESLPLTAYGDQVGELAWAGRTLRPSERALMSDLSGQIGGVVHSAGLMEDLRRTQEHLVAAREQERRRLRHDLHDGLGPSLAGLGFQVDTVRTLISAGRPPGERLDVLRRGLADTVAEVRRIVEGLRPPAIDELGLFGAVSALSRELADSSGLCLDIDFPEETCTLPAAVEVTAYRVAQEALTNVVRHADASRCRVAVSVTDQALVLEVHDDGRGGATMTSGVGMRSMRERADQIGGRLEVGAASPGTRVTLTLPLGARP